MKANETTIRNLLQGERQYVVPLYQRRYSWKRRDLAQLWADLMRVVEAGGTHSHFLGSVVLAPSPTNTPAGVQSWLVVDGQQRLTTLGILLCAIRDHVRDTDQQLAAKIDDLYLFNKYASGAERYTLLPTKADRAAWIALIERAPDAGGEDRIGEAYRYFRAALLQADDPDDEYDVVRIEQAVAGQLSIVEIAAHADDNVHRIFESLNYTGQPLTQADLLRNYLFMRLPNRGDDVYERQWLPLQELLTDKQLEQLVWLDLVLRGDDRATQESIYQAQQERLRQLPDEAAIEQWIIDLHHKARLFRKILDPQHEADPKLRQALDRLDRWGVAVVHPVALHVLLAHHADQLTAGEAAAALRVVESYLVRRTLVGLSSSNNNRLMMSLVKDLGEQIPSAKAIVRALSGPRKRFPTDQHVRDAVLANSFYWLGRGPQRAYVLRCIEEDHRHGEPLDFDKAKVTIEHVLPQSPTDEWNEMLLADLGDGETVFRPSRTRPDRPRSDFGAGLASPSDDGGFDEFDDDSFNRASRSAIRARACSSPASSSALRATRSSYDGGDDSADTTRQPTSVHNRHRSRPTTYPVTPGQASGSLRGALLLARRTWCSGAGLKLKQLNVAGWTIPTSRKVGKDERSRGVRCR